MIRPVLPGSGLARLDEAQQVVDPADALGFDSLEGPSSKRDRAALEWAARLREIIEERPSILPKGLKLWLPARMREEVEKL